MFVNSGESSQCKNLIGLHQGTDVYGCSCQATVTIILQELIGNVKIALDETQTRHLKTSVIVLIF